jgi:hypothetical protein
MVLVLLLVVLLLLQLLSAPVLAAALVPVLACDAGAETRPLRDGTAAQRRRPRGRAMARAMVIVAAGAAPNCYFQRPTYVYAGLARGKVTEKSPK